MDVGIMIGLFCGFILTVAAYEPAYRKLKNDNLWFFIRNKMYLTAFWTADREACKRLLDVMNTMDSDAEEFVKLSNITVDKSDVI